MTRKCRAYWLMMYLIMATCLTTSGCIGGLAQLFYVIKGHEIPAEYSNLKSKRVAIVVITDSSSYGPDPLADTVERFVSLKLATNVEKIKIVPSLEIDNWIDVNGWDQTEFQELGKGVKADFVLAINIDGYSIREGSTIYKGRSDVTVTIVESATGEVTHSFGPAHMEYPENGRPALQTDDRKFETFYLAWLTERIARKFYKHDRLADVADDAAFGG